MLGSYQSPIKALAHLVALFAMIWGIGYGISASRWSAQLYRVWRFPTTEAHHLAAKLGQAQLAIEDVCLLVGPSTVREAFDEDVMHEVVPDLRFLNGGTTGGGIYVFEAMNHLIQQASIRPKCIVVGLNARMLIARDIRLNAAGYTDFLDLTNGRALVAKEQPALRWEAHEQIVANTLWPYHRLSRQLGKLARTALFVAQDKLSWHEPLPVSAFCYGPRELGRSNMYRYDDTEPISGKQWERFVRIYEEEGLFDPKRYAHPEHLDSLRMVLDQLMKITPHLIVIQMPENSFGRDQLAPLASDAMATLLADYQKRGVHILDLSSALPDSAMRDVGHILASARPDFSRVVARFVTDCINGNEGAWHERTASYTE